MAKYLVTGGAGFIGSNIVEGLLRRGETVRVLDNFSTGKRDNLIPFGKDIELIEGDIRSYHIVRKAVDGVDFVLHQAALPSVPRSIEDPITSNEVNVGGTLNLLDACVDAGIGRMVYASSSSIYGDSESLPKKEEMLPNPLSPYAAAKFAGEKYCQIFHRIYGLETVCLRYFNIFGPRQDPNSQYSAVIPKFIASMKRGKPPVIFGDGEQSRDFTFVDNVVEANVLACRAGGVGGEVFNVASGRRYRLLDLVHRINDFLGSGIEPAFAERRRGDVVHSQADISKAERALSYHPEIQFPEGLKRTIPCIQAP